MKYRGFVLNKFYGKCSDNKQATLTFYYSIFTDNFIIYLVSKKFPAFLRSRQFNTMLKKASK